jgi:hypothetical protein
MGSGTGQFHLVRTQLGEGAMDLIPVLRENPLISWARIAGNIGRARRQRLASIISMIMVLIASIGMVLIASTATGATVRGPDITAAATSTLAWWS